MPLLDHFRNVGLEYLGYPGLLAGMTFLVMYLTYKIMEKPDDHADDKTRKKILACVFVAVLVGESLWHLSWSRFGWILLVELFLLGIGITSGFVANRSEGNPTYVCLLILFCWVGSTELGKFYQKAGLPSNTIEQVAAEWLPSGWKKSAATESATSTVPPQSTEVVKKPSAARHRSVGADKKAAKRAAHKKKEGE